MEERGRVGQGLSLSAAQLLQSTVTPSPATLLLSKLRTHAVPRRCSTLPALCSCYLPLNGRTGLFLP